MSALALSHGKHLTVADVPAASPGGASPLAPPCRPPTRPLRSSALQCQPTLRARHAMSLTRRQAFAFAVACAPAVLAARAAASALAARAPAALAASVGSWRACRLLFDLCARRCLRTDCLRCLCPCSCSCAGRSCGLCIRTGSRTCCHYWPTRSPSLASRPLLRPLRSHLLTRRPLPLPIARASAAPPLHTPGDQCSHAALRAAWSHVMLSPSFNAVQTADRRQPPSPTRTASGRPAEGRPAVG